MESLVKLYFPTHEAVLMVAAEPKIIKEKFKKAFENGEAAITLQGTGNAAHETYVISLQRLEYARIKEVR